MGRDAADVVGNWNPIWEEVGPPAAPEPGKVSTYARGAVLLQDCREVEDRGCGNRAFALHLAQWAPLCAYRGVDGSGAGGADEVVDLLAYSRASDGVYMRHVLEHNLRWTEILGHALNDFDRRLVLVLYTPTGGDERLLEWDTHADVPVLQGLGATVRAMLDAYGCAWREETLPTGLRTGPETVFDVARDAALLDRAPEVLEVAAAGGVL